jgi:hypothetical protein
VNIPDGRFARPAMPQRPLEIDCFIFAQGNKDITDQ